ncbi:MAG: hypothetical protein WC829_01805 [Hyphomicrobium sp.]|jgi:hypothetical protein
MSGFTDSIKQALQHNQSPEHVAKVKAVINKMMEATKEAIELANLMNNENVLTFENVGSTVSFTCDKILSQALGETDIVTVVGRSHDGSLYLASSESDAGTIMFWLELAKQKIITEALKGGEA